MADFETIFVGVSDDHADTQTYVRRLSDGFTVPHDSPLAPSIIGAQTDNATLKALGDALVKAGTIDQATLDTALTPVAVPIATPISPDGGITVDAPLTGSAEQVSQAPLTPPSAPMSVS